MSLLKQLLISVTVAICIILAGTLWFVLDGARSYLNERLQADAGNAAASLALSLSQPGNQDAVTQELLMTALFDSGQYRDIFLKAPGGEILFTLGGGEEARRAAVPPWFDTWLPLRAPTVVRAVSDGWKQTGEVGVTPQDTYAREALWRMTYQVLLLVVTAGLLWAVFAIFLIRWLKRGLHEEITRSVRAIVEDDVPTDDASAGKGPRIKELASVSRAIDSVRETVRATTEEQSRQIENLQVELHSDDVTGVANRRYFINELRRNLEAPAHGETAVAPGHGHVLIFRQRDLAAINALHDRSQADAWLRSVGDAVRRVLETHRASERPSPQLARLNGSDFVILLAGYDGPDATELIHALRQALDSLRIRTADGRLCRWSYALTDYLPGCHVSAVLTRLDHGLMRAENAGHDEVEYMASHDLRATASYGAHGETAWKTIIQEALRDDRLELAVERVQYRADDTPDRHEAFLMLRDHEGRSRISGYMFMPPAVRLGLSGLCDLRGVELAIDWVGEHSGTLVLRISLASLPCDDFLESLERILLHGDATLEQRQRIILEIDAHGFVAYPEELAAFCKLAENAGVGVGVRRLAEQPAALMRLHKVTTRYIKLGGELISGLLDSPGATPLIAAITEAAIGQGVKVYAHDVPNAATASLLLEYGVLLPVDEHFSPVSEETEGDFVDH